LNRISVSASLPFPCPYRMGPPSPTPLFVLLLLVFVSSSSSSSSSFLYSPPLSFISSPFFPPSFSFPSSSYGCCCCGGGGNVDLVFVVTAPLHRLHHEGLENAPPVSMYVSETCTEMEAGCWRECESGATRPAGIMPVRPPITPHHSTKHDNAGTIVWRRFCLSLGEGLG